MAKKPGVKMKTIARKDIDFGERRREDYGDLSQLAKSIEEKGLIQPIAVWEKNEVGESEPAYLLLAGGRRFRATELIGMEEIPCRIFSGELSDQTYREIELIENIERKDLSWSEQVLLKKEIHEMFVAKHGVPSASKGNQHVAAEKVGHTQADTAEALGESTATLSQDLKLADLLAVAPHLKNAKNKSEAQKMVRQITEEAVKEELRRRNAAKNCDSGIDKTRATIVSNYHVRDFFEGVKEIPDNSVQIVEIDPPYAIDLHAAKKGMADSKYNSEDYNEIDTAQYMGFLRRVLAECHRVMTPNSWLILWYAPEPWAEGIYKSIIDAGFHTRRLPGIWTKKQGQTMQPGRYLANAYEPFYVCSKGSPMVVKQGRLNVFDFPAVPNQRKIHPTERPVELITEILNTFGMPGFRVMVPFLGSGNTLLAASNAEMNAFGFDLSKGYKDDFALRVHAGIPGKYTSKTEKEG